MHRYVPPGLAATPAAQARFEHHARELRTDGMREADVRDQALAEKRRDAPTGAIDKLIGNHEIERLVLFFERSDRAQRQNALHAQRLESVDIGAKIQLRRRNPVTTPVPRQKRDFPARQLPDHVVVRRRAPRRLDRALLLRFKFRHRVQPAAADDSDFWFHACINSSSTPPVEEGCTKT